MLTYARAVAHGAEPGRIGVEPGVADRLFVLEWVNKASLRVRAVSPGAQALLMPDLKEGEFGGLLSEQDRALFHALLGACTQTKEPGILRAVGDSPSAHTLGLEIMLGPLKPETAGVGRFLGFVQPLGGEELLQGRQIVRIRIGAVLAPFARSTPARPRLVYSRS
jgi:hypothetical protein